MRATSGKSAVTGIGIISCIGQNAEENWKSLLANKTGIGSLRLFSSRHQVPVGEIGLSNEQLAEKAGLPAGKTYSRTALLGLIACQEALADAGIDISEAKKAGKKIGIINGTSIGGMDLSENYFANQKAGKRARLRDLFEHDCGASTMRIADHLGIKDFMTTISTACSSAANAIMLGDRMLRHHELDIVLVGGSDPLCKFTLNGFHSLGILDTELCRPFDATRTGLNLGEGAGFLVLQREEDTAQKTYCRLLGYANANDAFHQTATSEDGEGPYLAMKRALDKAGLQPGDIDYINAHGTGTGNNDQSEATAFVRLFGEHSIPRFSSTKVYTGHTLGACGGIEAAYCALMIKNGTIVPTYNHTQTMEGLDATPETQTTTATLKNVMSNSFGFGGNVSSLVFGE